MENDFPVAIPNTVYGGHTMDFTAQIHYAMNDAGHWFWRVQSKTPFGYRWGAWRSGGSRPERLSPAGKKARLPK